MSCNIDKSLEFTDKNYIKNIELNKPIYEWEIKNNLDLIENIKLNYDFYLNKVFLLDLDKFNNSKRVFKIDIIEKLVYDIYKFHYKKFNELANTDITFSLKSHNNINKNEINLKIKCDEYKKNKENKIKFPLLHSVTYLTDTLFPLLITNVDINQYKYKEFKNEDSILFYFPKKGNHIVFDHSKYHSYIKINDINSNLSKELNDNDLFLEVTLWEHENMPKNVPLYISIYKSIENYVDFNFDDVLLDNVEKIIDFYQDYSQDKKKKDYDPILDKKESFLLNPTFFEDLFYSKSLILLEPFLEKICESDKKEKNIFIFEKDKTKIDNFTKNKPLDIIIDMNNILNIKNDINRDNRFLQRHLFKNIYSSDACNWLIKECESYAKINGGWINNDYPDVYLDIRQIQPILSFILNSTETIISKILKSYCINNINPTFKILKIIIIKQDDNNNTNNIKKLLKDDGFFSFCISLNQPDNFEEGGIYFEDGITTHLEQGDALIYSGKIKHMNIPVTKGIKYKLFGFIDFNL